MSDSGFFTKGIRQLLSGVAPDGSPVATYRADLQGLGDATDSHYSPCWTGLHLCGVTDDGVQPTTVGNWQLSPAAACQTFAWFSERLGEVPADEADFVLDLQLSGDCDKGLYCNRQHLVALLSECEATGA